MAVFAACSGAFVQALQIRVRDLKLLSRSVETAGDA